jgi:hypothetical protein
MTVSIVLAACGPESSSSEDEAKARAAADELAAVCHCPVESVAEMAQGIWRVTLVTKAPIAVNRPETRKVRCFAVHVDDFRSLTNGQLTGFAPTVCR